MTEGRAWKSRQRGLSTLFVSVAILLFTVFVGVSVFLLLSWLSHRGESSLDNDRAPIVSTELKPARAHTNEKQSSDSRIVGGTGAESLEVLDDALDADIVLSDAPDLLDDTQYDSVENAVSTIDPRLTDDGGTFESPQFDDDRVVDDDGAEGDDLATEDEQASDSDTADSAGRLLIGGRVVTASGFGVPVITLKLRPIAASDPNQDKVRSIQSDQSGGFEFRNLLPGDYLLSSSKTNDYSESTAVVKAGVTSIELRLSSRNKTTITGKVMDEQNQPVADALIVVAGDVSDESDDAGRYQLNLLADSERSYAIRFVAKGFREEVRYVHVSNGVSSSTMTVDVNLSAAGPLTAYGMVQTETGQAIEGATVWLTSTRLGIRGQATSDANGEFEIAGLRAANDYRIIANRSGYVRHQRDNVRIDADPAPIDIELSVLPVGSISGTILDANRNAIPDFTILVVSVDSSGQSLALTSDENGFFQVDGIPSGEIRFQTRSVPSMSISGLDLPIGQNIQAELIVDWGDNTVTGVVVDEAGEPVSRAQMVMRWQSRHGELLSDSMRPAQTDAQGRFRFSELGPGKHEIVVPQSARFVEKKIVVDVGNDTGLKTIVVSRRR